MTENHFNNNNGILNIKSYCKWVTGKTSIILFKETEINTIKNNSYFFKKDLINYILSSTYVKNLGISINRFEENCIIIQYLQFELTLFLYPNDYDRTIRNLKFECSKYSVNDNIQEHLLLFMDENWDLLIEFTENNKANNYFEIDKVIPNSSEVILN